MQDQLGNTFEYCGSQMVFVAYSSLFLCLITSFKMLKSNKQNKKTFLAQNRLQAQPGSRATLDKLTERQKKPGECNSVDTVVCLRVLGWHFTSTVTSVGLWNDLMSYSTLGRNVNGRVHYDLLTWNSRPGRKGKGCMLSYSCIESLRTIPLSRMLIKVEIP